MQIVTLLYFSRLGIVASGTLTAYLLCIPALLAGTWLGLRMFAAVDEAVLRQIVSGSLAGIRHRASYVKRAERDA